MMAIRQRELEKLEWKKKKMLLHRILGGKVMMIMVIVMIVMTIAMIIAMIVITISIQMAISQKNNKTNCSRQDMENFPLLQPSKFAPTLAITIW